MDQRRKSFKDMNHLAKQPKVENENAQTENKWMDRFKKKGRKSYKKNATIIIFHSPEDTG